MYRKLAGMTGTADTEAAEFKKTYKLDVLVMPPNRQMIRIDHPDIVYKTEREKFNAVVDEIVECHGRGQPVLVGTISVEKSEQLAKLLKKRGVKHNVLNAVNHEAEANIIAQAGRFSSVTIATNMAGRGTDILLGGNADFLARAEMENEWVRRSSSMPDGAHRYEDVLTRLREEFDEAVQRAEKTFQPLWAPYEEAQGKALEALTDTHRKYLEAGLLASPHELRDRNGRVGRSCQPDGDDGVCRGDHPVQHGTQEIDGITGPHFGEEGSSVSPARGRMRGSCARPHGTEPASTRACKLRVPRSSARVAITSVRFSAFWSRATWAPADSRVRGAHIRRRSRPTRKPRPVTVSIELATTRRWLRRGATTKSAAGSTPR
jgi:hypothetical protein